MAYYTIAEADTYYTSKSPAPVGWEGLQDTQKTSYLQAASTRFDSIAWEGSLSDMDTRVEDARVEGAFFEYVRDLVEDRQDTVPQPTRIRQGNNIVFTMFGDFSPRVIARLVPLFPSLATVEEPDEGRGKSGIYDYGGVRAAILPVPMPEPGTGGLTTAQVQAIIDQRIPENRRVPVGGTRDDYLRGDGTWRDFTLQVGEEVWTAAIRGNSLRWTAAKLPLNTVIANAAAEEGQILVWRSGEWDLTALPTGGGETYDDTAVRNLIQGNTDEIAAVRTIAQRADTRSQGNERDISALPDWVAVTATQIPLSKLTNLPNWVRTTSVFIPESKLPRLTEAKVPLGTVVVRETPTDGQFLTYNGTRWVPVNAPSGGEGSGARYEEQVLIRDGTNRTEDKSITLPEGYSDDWDFLSVIIARGAGDRHAGNTWSLKQLAESTALTPFADFLFRGTWNPTTRVFSIDGFFVQATIWRYRGSGGGSNGGGGDALPSGGTSADYLRGDGTWQPFDTQGVDLHVDSHALKGSTSRWPEAKIPVNTVVTHGDPKPGQIAIFREGTPNRWEPGDLPEAAEPSDYSAVRTAAQNADSRSQANERDIRALPDWVAVTNTQIPLSKLPSTIARTSALPSANQLVPTGGTAGQLLSVASDGTGRTWIDPPSGGGSDSGRLTLERMEIYRLTGSGRGPTTVEVSTSASPLDFTQWDFFYVKVQHRDALGSSTHQDTSWTIPIQSLHQPARGGDGITEFDVPGHQDGRSEGLIRFVWALGGPLGGRRSFWATQSAGVAAVTNFEEVTLLRYTGLVQANIPSFTNLPPVGTNTDHGTQHVFNLPPGVTARMIESVSLLADVDTTAANQRSINLGLYQFDWNIDQMVITGGSQGEVYRAVATRGADAITISILRPLATDTSFRWTLENHNTGGNTASWSFAISRVSIKMNPNV